MVKRSASTLEVPANGLRSRPRRHGSRSPRADQPAPLRAGLRSRPGHMGRDRAAHDALRPRRRLRSAPRSSPPLRYNDVWALSLSDPSAAWTHVETAGGPPTAREYTSAIYDAANDCLVVYGCYEGGQFYYGGGVNNVGAPDDAWALSLSASPPRWTRLNTAGTHPRLRWGQTAIYDAPRQRLVIFGGSSADGAIASRLDDCWALPLDGSGGPWVKLAPVDFIYPGARLGASAPFDPLRGRLIVFGGQGTNIPYYNDSWAGTLSADSVQWALLAPSAAKPSARSFPVATYH